MHTLKSTSRLIGAFKLSEKARELEMAAREDDFDKWESETESVIESYKRIYKHFEEVFGK